MVRFQDLLDTSFCTTDAEIVGLACWYLHEYEAVDQFSYDDVADVLRSAGVVLSSQNTTGIVTSHSRFVINPLDSLGRRELVKEVNPGFRLTEKGHDHFGSKIDYPLPDEDAPNDSFINVDTEGFHSDAISEINLCYNVGAYSATMIMTRRLLEDLLIDVYRAHFGDDDIQKYYVPESGRHQRLGELIAIFDENIGQLAVHTTAIDKSSHGFHDDLDSFVNRANSQAHSVNIHISKSEIKDRSDTATRLVKVLLEMRFNARSTE